MESIKGNKSIIINNEKFWKLDERKTVHKLNYFLIRKKLKLQA